MEGVTLKGVSKSYGGLSVLQGLDMEFEGGRISCILGPSGAGKTTILNIICGMTDYLGTVSRGGGAVSYIYQDERLIESLTVYGNLEYVLLAVEKDGQKRRQAIEHILETVELSQKSNSYPRQLSGGMRQRVSMARAFVYPSALLLMDEPFRSLDIALKKRMTEAFLKLWEADRRTVIFVTHDIDEALLLSDAIYVIKGVPAKICGRFEVSEPQRERDLASDGLLRLRKQVYRALTE